MLEYVYHLIIPLPTLTPESLNYHFQVNFRVPSKQINLDDKTCKLNDGTRVPCVDVDVSLKYDGVGVPNTIGQFLPLLFLDVVKINCCWLTLQFPYNGLVLP